MERNLELLKKTWEFIQANPTKHDQSDWIEFEPCNTTMCFAGHAAVLSGAEAPKDTLSWRVDHLTGKLSPVEHHPSWGDQRREGMLIEDWAREKLGMTSRESEFIFYCMDNENLAGRVEHLIQLWENGEQFDRYEYDEEVEQDYFCCERCG